MNDKTIQDVVFGRVALPGEALFDASDHRVEAWAGKQHLASARTDKAGRFRLDLKPGCQKIFYKPANRDSVCLRVFAPWGTEIQRRALSRAEITSRRELLLRAALPPDILSADATGAPVPRVVNLVSDADMNVFHMVTAIAALGDRFPHPGGPLGEVDRIYEILDELESIYHWAYGALRGDPRHLWSLKSHLEQQPCFANGHHDVPDAEPVTYPVATASSKNYLTIEDTDALPLAGVLLDAMESEADAKEHTWAERARCYYLSRAAVIQRVFGAAEFVSVGAMEPAAFAALLMDAASRPAHTEDHDDDANVIAPIQAWDDATIRWARRAEQLQAAAKQEISTRDIPLLTARADPPAIAKGADTRLTLFPATESRFPKRPSGRLDGIIALWHGGKRHLLKILNWTESAIEVELPRDLPAGMGTIYWEAPSPTLRDRIQQSFPGILSGQLDPTPSQDRVPSAYYVPGQIAFPVLIPFVTLQVTGNADATYGQRPVAFNPIGGQTQTEWEDFTRAEACTDARVTWDGGVSWSSEPFSGSGSLPTNVRFHVIIRENGAVIHNGSSESGDTLADPIFSARYEVQLEAFIGTESLGVATATWSLDRYARIRLDIADRVHLFTAPVRVTVRISCPAPAGGLRVQLTSHPVLLTSRTVTVPEGRTSLNTSLLSSGVHGPGALLTATASDHEPGTAFVHLGDTSCIGERFGGRWEIASAALNVVGVHIAVLHTGKVLLFNYDEGHFPIEAERASGQWLSDMLSVADSNKARCQLWDPATGVISTAPLNRNLFCSGLAFLPDGRLFVASGQFHVPVWAAALAAVSAPAFVTAFLGPALPLNRPDLAALLPFTGLISAAAVAGLAAGHSYEGADKDLHLFRPTAPVESGWERILPNMQVGRWYPTCVTLPSGEVMVISGTSGALSRPIFGGIQDSIEIFDPMHGTRRALIHLDFHIRHLYPFMHVLPSGKVFLHWKRRTALFDPNTGRFDHFPGILTQHPFSRTGPGPGTSVLLPLLPTRSSGGQVTYPAGKVMILGGGGAEGAPEPAEDGDPPYTLSHSTRATNTVEIWDFGAPAPAWRLTASMSHERVMPDSVILPNGKILVVNGARKGMAGAFGSHLGNLGPTRDPVLEAELFDPVTETWETLCRKTIPRIYHATAALLPDGRVLVAGHDGLLNNFKSEPGQPPNTSSKYQLEIFSPPYLFRGPRPVVRSAPSSIAYGSAFQVEMNIEVQEVESVCMIRQSSVTHQINTDQRYVGLAIIPTMSRTSVTVQAPPNSNIAPPGFYMLFVVNRRGVPSIAKWVQIG
jgi:hypothetical protein